MKPLLFGGLIIAAPLAVGGVHFAVVLALLVLSLLYWCGERNISTDSSLRLPLPATAMGLFALTCALQLLPVPPAFHRVLDPRGWQLYLDGAVLLQQAPHELSWRPLSLAPAQTADRALRWLTLGVWALVATDFAGRKNAWHLCLRVLVVAGLAQLAVGLIQLALGTEAILFLYEPTAGAVEGFTTFVNTNHAAVFYGLISLAAVALSIHTYHRNRIECSAAAALAVAFMIAMTEHESQGASLAYWMSLSVMSLALLVRVHPTGRVGAFVKKHFFGLATASALAVPAVITMLWWCGPSSLQSWLINSHFGEWLQRKALVRLELARAALDAAVAHPWVGAGGGATGTTLAPFIDWNIVPAATIPTIENEPIEWVFTLGFPAAIAGCLLFASFFLIVIAHHRNTQSTRLLVVSAVGLYFVANAQLHFPFFTLGLAIPFVAVLVIGLSTGSRRGPSSESGLSQLAFVRINHVAILAILLLATIGAVGFSSAYYAVFTIGEHEANAKVASVEEFVEAQRFTPAKGRLYAQAALVALNNGDEDRALDLIEHAYRCDPSMPIGLARAGVLAQANRPKRTVEAYSTLFSNHLPQRLRLRDRGLQQLIEDISDARARALALRSGTPADWNRGFSLIAENDGAAAATLFALALTELHPKSYEAFDLLVRGYFHQGNYFLAERVIRQFLLGTEIVSKTSSSSGYALLSIALRKQGRHNEAYELVANHAEALERDREFWRSSTSLLPGASSTADPDFAGAIEQGHSRWCRGPLDQTSRLYCWHAEAWIAEQSNELQAAEWAYRRLYSQTGQPNLLMDFYSRHFRCKKMELLMHAWFEEHRASERKRALFEAMIRSCKSKLR